MKKTYHHVKQSKKHKNIPISFILNDMFIITGDIENIGTIPANNVSVFVETELRNYTFNLYTINQILIAPL